MFVIQFAKEKENKIFENVNYIECKVCTEKGIVEDEMSYNDVNNFIELINDLQLEDVKENDSVKGWFISLDCYNNRREYMYNAHLIGNLFYIDKNVFYVNEENLNKLEQFIYNLI